jgi:DNA-binding PadR family transcriptional regulator
MEDYDFGPRHFDGHEHHHGHGWKRRFMQARRGDMKYIILNVLIEGPMHGYDVMRKLEEKSEGLWRPSPGSVYPTLQLLEDEDLVSIKFENDKKVYTITDEGRKETEKHPLKNPWERWEKDDVKKLVKIRSAMKDIMPALAKINHTDDDKKIEKALGIIQKASEELSELAEKE